MRPLTRHPSELPALLLTLGPILLLLLIFAPFTFGVVLIAAALGLGFQMLMAVFWLGALKKKASPIGQHPALAEVVDRCRARLGMKEPVEVLVVDEPIVNAFATGLWAPYTVVLYTGLLKHLSLDEAAFVVGHELGHIRFRHTAILALVGQLGTARNKQFMALILHLVFLKWSRLAEHTADRAGLVACGELGPAVSALAKVGLGPEKAASVDVDGLIQHWRTHDAGWKEGLGAVLSTHPGLETRLDRLVDWGA